MRRQRCPADRPPTTPASRRAEEAHHRRREDRPAPGRQHHDRRRHHHRRPGPGAVIFEPASVMRGGEAPGLRIPPGPAPGVGPAPIALAEGHPAGGHLRAPDIAIFGMAGPAAEFRQLPAAGHQGDGLRHFVEFGFLGQRPGEDGRGLAGGGDGRRLAAGGQRPAGAEEDALPIGLYPGGMALLHHHAGGRALRARLDHIAAGLEDFGGAARGGDAQYIVGVQRVDQQRGLALGQAGFGAGIIQPGPFQAAAALQAQIHPGQFQQGAAAGFGPQRAAGGDRQVAFGRLPLRLARVAQGDPAREGGQPPGAGRRVGDVLFFRRGRGRGGGGRDPGLEITLRQRAPGQQQRGAKQQAACGRGHQGLRRAARGERAKSTARDWGGMKAIARAPSLECAASAAPSFSGHSALCSVAR